MTSEVCACLSQCVSVSCSGARTTQRAGLSRPSLVQIDFVPSLQPTANLEVSWRNEIASDGIDSHLTALTPQPPPPVPPSPRTPPPPPGTDTDEQRSSVACSLQLLFYFHILLLSFYKGGGGLENQSHM